MGTNGAPRRFAIFCGVIARLEKNLAEGGLTVTKKGPRPRCRNVLVTSPRQSAPREGRWHKALQQTKRPSLRRDRGACSRRYAGGSDRSRSCRSGHPRSFIASGPLTSASHIGGQSSTIGVAPLGFACSGRRRAPGGVPPRQRHGLVPARGCAVSGAQRRRRPVLAARVPPSPFSPARWHSRAAPAELGTEHHALRLGLSIFPDGHFSSRAVKWSTWLVFAIGAA